MNIKNFSCIIIFLSFFILKGQTKDELLARDINGLMEEMQFMYAYDQALREYPKYQTFDKSETNRLESLADSSTTKEVVHYESISDSLEEFIFKEYINPKDALHTKRMIEIIKRYGFPDISRINKFYSKSFKEVEFKPYLLLIHSPKEFWDELKFLLKQEYDQGRMSQCTFGYLLWHISGRESFQPMLDNGYKLVQENGKTILKSTCNQ
ncbi:MAG: hypothetical protein VYB38_08835 [Bacteroidota bacterium]|nr:hypothetical protein [Bacteroidota bacterium]